MFQKGELVLSRGNVAIVTGGAVRLGRAITLALAEAGMNICLHYGRSKEEAEETRKQAETFGVEVVTVGADFSKPVEAARMVVDCAAEAFGRVDVLINNAAVFEPGNIESTTEDQWDRHFDINLKAPFFLCRAFKQQLATGARGQIVNIADWRATKPAADHLAYTLTKGALVTMTKSLARALAPEIQVNAVAPGAVLPPSGEDAAYLDRLAQHIPLKRTGSTGDVTQAVLFLLRSDFITGEILHVTGGEEL